VRACVQDLCSALSLSFSSPFFYPACWSRFQGRMAFPSPCEVERARKRKECACAHPHRRRCKRTQPETDMGRETSQNRNSRHNRQRHKKKDPPHERTKRVVTSVICVPLPASSPPLVPIRPSILCPLAYFPLPFSLPLLSLLSPLLASCNRLLPFAGFTLFSFPLFLSSSSSALIQERSHEPHTKCPQAAAL